MLHTAGLSLPTKVHIHGFLKVGGKKMSKSEGTFVTASTYLQHLDPSFLRYYFASKLGPRNEDLDLNLEEFSNRNNADLVGKVVNLASRTARFVQKIGLSSRYPDDGGRFAAGAAAGVEIAAAYEACDYNRAMRLVMELADAANPFVEAEAPWALRHDPAQHQRLQDVCTVALNLFRQLTIYLAPVLPRLAVQASQLLQAPLRHWDEAQRPLVGTPVQPFEHMLQRVDPKQVMAMIEASKSGEGSADSTSAQAQQPPSVSPPANAQPSADDDGPLRAEPLQPEITIDDFAKVDLRVARIVAAEEVPEARKLLKLTVSLGGDHRRTVFAGIKQAYEPAQLVGRLVIVVANLAPRPMKFGLSEGMVVASGPGGRDVFLLTPDTGAQPGQRVH
jgi:methionyl-tRNA synthetase